MPFIFRGHFPFSHSSSLLWGTFHTDVKFVFSPFCELSSQETLSMYVILACVEQLWLEIGSVKLPTYTPAAWLGQQKAILSTFISFLLSFHCVPFFLCLKVISISINYLVSQTDIYVFFFFPLRTRALELNAIDNLNTWLFGPLICILSHAQGFQVTEVCCPQQFVCRN